MMRRIGPVLWNLTLLAALPCFSQTNTNPAFEARLAALETRMQELEPLKARVADLEARIQQLEPLKSRLTNLEARIQELERTRNTVKAPFQVVDSAGSVLMSVEASDDLTILTVGTVGKGMVRLMAEGDEGRLAVAGTGGKSLFMVQATATELEMSGKSDGLTNLVLHSQDPATRAIMYVKQDAATVAVASQTKNIAAMSTGKTDCKITTTRQGGAHTQMGSGSDGVEGLVISQAESKQTLGEISQRTGKKLALRLYNDAGLAVVTAGANPAAAGAGTVRAANTKGENVAFLGTMADGDGGVVGVAKGGKDMAAMMAEPRMIALYNDTGAPIATLTKSQDGSGSGGNVTIRDPAGDGVFTAGYNGAVGGGDACVYRAKKQTVFCLGIGVPGMGAIGR